MREIQKGPSGTTWMRIETQDEINAESAALNHLAALLFAHAEANKLPMQFISLRRDKDNAPLVTLQVKDKEIVHAAAKNNTLPPKIEEAIREYANATMTPIGKDALKYAKEPGEKVSGGIPPEMWVSFHKEALEKSGLLDKVPQDSKPEELAEEADGAQAAKDDDSGPRDSRAVGYTKWK